MPTAQNILVLAGSADFDAVGDAPMKTRLATTLGHTLDIRDGDGTPAGSAVTTAANVASWDAGDDLIFISSSMKLASIDSGIVAAVATPVVHCEGWIWEEDLLAKPGASGETSTTQTQIDILDAAHPVAGGLSGTVTILTTAYKLNYCHLDALPDGAVAIASVAGDPNRIVLYVIESGDQLADGTAAPARRCCLPFTYSTPTVWNSNATAIFDAAIDWTGNPDTAVTPSGTSTGTDNDEGSLYAVDATALRPTITVEIAFGYGPDDASPVWTDVSSAVRKAPGIAYSRGRSSDLGRTEAGQASVTLDSRNREFEPGYASGANYPDVVLRTPIRFRASWFGRTFDLFYGYVDAWIPSYPGQGSDAVVQVLAVDGQGLAARRRCDGGHLPAILTDAATPAVYYPLDETSGTTFAETLRAGPTIPFGAPSVLAGNYPLAGTVAGDGISRAQNPRMTTYDALLIPADVNVETAGAVSMGWWMRENLDDPATGNLLHDVRLSDFSEYSWLVQIEPGAGGAAIPTSTWGTLTSGSGTTNQPTIPTHAIGDLLIAVWAWDASGTSNETGPTGWTQIGTTLETDDGATSSKMAAYKKVATSASTTNPILELDNTETIIGGVIVIPDANSEFDATVFDSTVTDETVPAITTTSAALILKFAGADGNDAPFTAARAGSGTTEEWDGETAVGGDISIWGGWAELSTFGTEAAEALTYTTTPPAHSNFIVLAVVSNGGGGVLYDHHSDGTGATITVAATSDLMDGDVHHFALTRASDANTIKGYVDKILVGSVTHTEASAPSSDTACGFAWGWNYKGWVGGYFCIHDEITDDDVADIYDAGLDRFPAEPTDGRIRKLLQYLSTPTALQNLDPGLSSMPAEDLHGQYVADALSDAMEAELGILFWNGAGVATFHSRSHRAATNPVLSVGAGTSILAHDVVLTNPANNAVDSVVVEVQDQTSAAATVSTGPTLGIEEKIGPLKVLSTTLARSYADHLLTVRSSGEEVRIEEITFRPGLAPADMYAPLLDVEIGDRLDVTLDPLSDSPTADRTLSVYVEHLDVTSTEDSWTIRFRLSPSTLSIVSF